MSYDLDWPVFQTWSFQIPIINDSWEETNKIFWEIEPKIRNVVDIGYSDRCFLFDDVKHFEAAIKVMEENNIQYRIW